MKVYVLLHTGDDVQIGHFADVKLYPTREEAEAARDAEIEAAAKELCGKYVDQPDEMEVVKQEIIEDGIQSIDGDILDFWTISEHDVNIAAQAQVKEA